MPHADFVHLRVHTPYSLSEGAIKIADLVKLCVGEAMPAVAVTDTNNLFGALEFAMAAVAEGVQPIVGCQLAVAPMETDAAAPGNGRMGARPGRRGRRDFLVLLVQDEEGYRNLMALVSKAFLESEAGDPHVSFRDVALHASGLIALTAGASGALGRLLADGQVQKASGALQQLREAFPGRLYIELTRHGEEIERRIEDDLIDFAMTHDLPLVATNEAYFADASMHEAHDALLCIAEGTHVAEQERRRLTVDHRFRSADEMRALFADLPEALDNTLAIARRCAFMPEPREPILPRFETSRGDDEAEALAAAAQAGLEARLQASVYEEGATDEQREEAARPYRERLEFELRTIIEMGYPGYFLIVADFIQWAKKHGIPVGPGRVTRQGRTRRRRPRSRGGRSGTQLP